MRILLIDYDKDITDTISLYCQSQAIDCDVINQGNKGLEGIRDERFDLILLDLAMPDFSGMDVLLSLKLDGLISSINIVIFTASSNQDLLNEMRDMGVKEIFKKPFSLDNLTKLIERYRPESERIGKK